MTQTLNRQTEERIYHDTHRVKLGLELQLCFPVLLMQLLDLLNQPHVVEAELISPGQLILQQRTSSLNLFFLLSHRFTRFFQGLRGQGVIPAFTTEMTNKGIPVVLETTSNLKQKHTWRERSVRLEKRVDS